VTHVLEAARDQLSLGVVRRSSSSTSTSSTSTSSTSSISTTTTTTITTTTTTPTTRVKGLTLTPNLLYYYCSYYS